MPMCLQYEFNSKHMIGMGITLYSDADSKVIIPNYSLYGAGIVTGWW